MFYLWVFFTFECVTEQQLQNSIIRSSPGRCPNRLTEVGCVHPSVCR